MRGLLKDSDPVVRAETVWTPLADSQAASARSPLSLLAAISDPDPRVQDAALLACFSPDEALNDAVWAAIIHGPARSSDTYLRQPAAFLLAQRGTLAQLQSLTAGDDAATRLAGILAAGFRLTVPPATQSPAAESTAWTPWARCGEGLQDRVCRWQVDLRIDAAASAAPIPSSIVLLERRPACGRARAALRPASCCRFEGFQREDQLSGKPPFFSRSAERPAQRAGHLPRRFAASFDRRLAAAPLRPIDALWVIGPFADGDKGLAAEHEPERGPIDLGRTYQEAGASLGWTEQQGQAGLFGLTSKLPHRARHRFSPTCASGEPRPAADRARRRLRRWSARLAQRPDGALQRRRRGLMSLLEDVADAWTCKREAAMNCSAAFTTSSRVAH